MGSKVGKGRRAIDIREVNRARKCRYGMVTGSEGNEDDNGDIQTEM